MDNLNAPSPLSLTKDTISVRKRVPVVPFLRRARRPPRAPKPDLGDRLRRQSARAPRERLRMARTAHSPLWLRPGRERRGRIGAQLVAALSPAATRTRTRTGAKFGLRVEAAAWLGRDRRRSPTLVPYPVRRLSNAHPGISPSATDRAISTR